MKLLRKTITAAAALLATAAFADVNVGISLSLTGPGSGLGIPMNNYYTKSFPKTIGGEKVNLIIATGQNNGAMNRTIGQIAHHYLSGSQLSEGLLNRVEAGIRCFDPCLSCSTHAAGQMPLVVQLLAADGALLDHRRRD